jgi:methylglutaconyl-CoA hydratase
VTSVVSPSPSLDLWVTPGGDVAALVGRLMELDAEADTRMVGLRVEGVPAAEARLLDQLLRTVDWLGKPTVAVARGELGGSAVGLVAACDIALASTEASFAMEDSASSVVAPYVVRAMGARQAARYLLTAERLNAEEARQLGLIHAVFPAEHLDAEARRMAEAITSREPATLAATKRALRLVRAMPQEGSLLAEALLRLANPAD